MLKNKKLRDELTALFRAGDYRYIAKWFSYWQDQNEMIDKALLFGHFFMPEFFRDQSPKFHREILRAYFSKKNEYEAAPRGFSKTTLFQMGILFDCVNELERFIVVVEKTFTEAAEVISVVRDQCVENKLLIAVYGDLLKNKKSEKLVTSADSKTKDAQGDVVVNGVRLRAKGFDQPIRGLKAGAWRPTKILCDDIEQDQHINSPEQRLKYENNYNKGIQPAVDRDGKIKMFGTILHEDSLLSNQIKLHNGKIFRAYYVETDAEWKKHSRACTDSVDDKGQPIRLLWASRWSWDALMRKKADMVSKGQSNNAFEQEYRNNPIAEEERKFKYEWLWDADRIIRFSELKKKGLNLVGYAAIDAADSTAEGSDFTAAVVHFIDSNNNRYRVDVRNDKRNITGLIDLIFEIWTLYHRMGLTKIGVEKKAYNDQVKPLLDIEKQRRNIFPVVEELKPLGRSKESRILGSLQGLYEYAKIWTVTDDFDRPVGATEVLLNQLYNFPSSAKDDLSDAEAYISDMAKKPSDQRGDTVTNTPDDDPYGSTKQRAAALDPFDEVIEGNPNYVEEDPY